MAEPIKPPGPTEPTQPEAGGGGGKKCKPETRRKTDIIRVYSDDKGSPPTAKEPDEAPKGSGATDRPRGPGEPIESPPPGFGTPQPGGGGSAPPGGGGGGEGTSDTDKPATPTPAPPRPKCSKDGKFWVDIEVVRNATFKGAQWRGPAAGNQPQETIWKPSPNYTGHQGTDIVKIKIKKDKEDKKDKPQKPTKDKDDVDLRNKRCSKMATAGANVERSFKNEGDDKGDKDKGNSCRKNNSHKKRVAFNPIEKTYLRDEPAKRDQPPRNPKKYQDAVKKSMAQQAAQQGPPIWLLVEIEKKDKEMRAKQLRKQGIERKEIWGNGNVALPGSETSKGNDLKEPHIRTDPYQKIINFGPDGLAVEFEGTGSTGGSAGGGDLGGAFGGIAGGITGGAQPAG